ncbi:hypothetical protein EMCG_01354, partial [[Emmonsia] crescens]
IEKKEQRKKQKEIKFLELKKKRLILKVSDKSIFEKSILNDSKFIFKLRNEINQNFHFETQNNEEFKSVIFSIEVLFLENSIILTIISDFSSEYLI